MSMLEEVQHRRFEDAMRSFRAMQCRRKREQKFLQEWELAWMNSWFEQFSAARVNSFDAKGERVGRRTKRIRI